MNNPIENNKLRAQFFRGLIEAGFIIFLFYANLLMGDFTRSGNARGRSLIWGIEDVFTTTNFEIAIVAAIIGYLVFEYLRKKI